MAARAGLVLGDGTGLCFVSAGVARSLHAEPEISEVPGTSIGMALLGGEVLPVVSLGSGVGALVICEIEGERIAFSGLVPQSSGWFEECPGGVRVGSASVPELDLVGALKRAESDLHMRQSRRK